MGDTPLSKAELDATVSEWERWRAEMGAPVVKSAPAATVKAHDATLIGAIMQGLAPHIHGLEQKIAALVARIVELEARPEAKYLGVWSAKEYSSGSMVTDHGALWHCGKRTTDRPGASADWTLAEKSSRDDTVAHARNGHAGAPAIPRRA